MSEVIMRKERPKHLAIFQIRLPIPGIVSILHRASGVGLFLFLPFLLWLFQLSVESSATFTTFASIVSHPLAKLVLLGLMWAYLHHFCAGIRFLLLDLGKGLDLQCARTSARFVVVVSLALTIILGVMLW